MEDYFRDVPEEKVFYLGDKRIKNLHGLLFELRSIDDSNYGHYAGESHNYFADWIEHVIGSKDLSGLLRESKSRKEAISNLEKGIEGLKKEKPKKEEPSSEVKEQASNTPEQLHDSLVLEAKEKEEELAGFVVSDPDAESKKAEETENAEEAQEPAKEKSQDIGIRIAETESLLRKVSKDEKEIKDFLWKHFAWDMAKEFMYGMALGILVGLVLSKIFFRV